MQVGKRLSNARTEKGWTKSQLAKRSGVARNTIARIENGCSCRDSTPGKLAQALGNAKLLDEAPSNDAPKKFDQFRLMRQIVSELTEVTAELRDLREEVRRAKR